MEYLGEEKNMETILLPQIHPRWKWQCRRKISIRKVSFVKPIRRSNLIFLILSYFQLFLHSVSSSTYFSTKKFLFWRFHVLILAHNQKKSYIIAWGKFVMGGFITLWLPWQSWGTLVTIEIPDCYWWRHDDVSQDCRLVCNFWCLLFF